MNCPVCGADMKEFTETPYKYCQMVDGKIVYAECIHGKCCGIDWAKQDVMVRKAEAWEDHIVGAVHKYWQGDNKVLSLLGKQMVEVEQAKQYLRDLGYGCTGMGILETVKEVLPVIKFASSETSADRERRMEKRIEAADEYIRAMENERKEMVNVIEKFVKYLRKEKELLRK